VLAQERGEIAPGAYLDEFNQLVAADFRRLEAVLGRRWPRRSSIPRPSAAHGLEGPSERD
jgi:hypothetical protein